MNKKINITDEQIQWLKDNHSTLGKIKCGKILGIGWQTIERMIKNSFILARAKWTDSEIQWLKTNYPTTGAAKLAESSRFTKNQIYMMAKKLQLKLEAKLKEDLIIHRGVTAPHMKEPEYIKTAEGFKNVISPEHAYLLGFLWADGYVTKQKLKYAIICHLEKNDGLNLLNLFMKTGYWKYIFIPAKNKNREGIRIWIDNKLLHEYLVENDYNNKTFISANKILNTIPEHLKGYWWRGYFDGDGHIAKSSCYCLSFTAHYNMDGNFILEACKTLNVDIKIRKTQRLNNNKLWRSSQFIITGKESITKFYKFMYSIQYDGIGLKRKWEVFHAKNNAAQLNLTKTVA